MRMEPLALLVGLLDAHGISHATRPRATVLSQLAFAVPPPPTSRPPARPSPGGVWTGRGARVRTPAGRLAACPLTSGRRERRATTATSAAAATREASVRTEPAGGRSGGSSRSSNSSGGGRGRGRGKARSSSSKGGSRVSPPAASPRQGKPKRPRSPGKKPVSSVASAAAAAAVDPSTAGSDFVASMTVDGSSSGSGGGGAPAAAAASLSASVAPGPRRKSGSKAAPGRGRTSAARKAAPSGLSGSSSSSSSRSSGGVTRPKQRPARKQKYGDLSARRAKALRTGGRAFFIVCDAESITFPELVESIDILDGLGTRDAGVIYADWEKNPHWRSERFGRSKARDFKLLQRDAPPLSPGSDSLGDDLRDDTMTADLVALARSEEFKKTKKYEFCLVSADGSLAGLAARLRQEGVLVRGVGRRQAPEEFLQNCDAFMYIDPANRFELLDSEGLVISVALCIALAAAGSERCDWVRMKTIVNSLHAWDLGLESPNYFGYWDYDEVVAAMDAYVTGVEDTSGEVVVKVPPKPKAGEVPRGLEDVATYLYQKWVSFTKEPQMNDILLACIPACLQALSAAREETSLAVKRFHRNDRLSVHMSDLD